MKNFKWIAEERETKVITDKAPRVLDVAANEDFTLILTFENKETVVFDMKKYLNRGVFTELKDYELFKKVKLDFDVVKWESGVELSTDHLYFSSLKKYEDNFEEKDSKLKKTSFLFKPNSEKDMSYVAEDNYSYKEVDKAVTKKSQKVINELNDKS